MEYSKHIMPVGTAYNYWMCENWAANNKV